MTTTELKLKAYDLLNRMQQCGCGTDSKPTMERRGSLALTVCQHCGGLTNPK